MKLKALGRYDAEEREVRLIDQFQYFTWLVIVACMVGMALWVNHIGHNVTNVGHRVAREQAALNAEAKNLGADRAQLINGCERTNRLLVSNNTASEGTYIVFKYLIAVYNSAPQKVKKNPEDIKFAQLLRSASNAQSWTPKTNCQKLIGTEGSDYKLPAAIPFAKQPAPASQLLHPEKTK